MLIVFLVLYGIAIGNDWQFVFREAIAFLEMGVFLLLGVDDRLWRVLAKHLTVLFFVALLLIWVYRDTPLPEIYAAIEEPINFRYTNSAAYLIRPLIAPGLLLGIWGLVNHSGGIWKFAQASALFGVFVSQVYLFKFRGEAVFTALTVISFLIVRPFLARHSRPASSALVLTAAVLGMWVYSNTHSWQMLKERQANEAELLLYRWEEANALRKQLGWTMLVGKGLGGSFDASSVRPGETGAFTWRTVHLGSLIFVLKGGPAFLAAFWTFVLPGRKRRSPSWYANPCNLTAGILFPIYLLQWIINPIQLSPDALFQNLPGMMILARYGLREPIYRFCIQMPPLATALDRTPTLVCASPSRALPHRRDRSRHVFLPRA